jgi:hypothetical protein
LGEGWRSCNERENEGKNVPGSRPHGDRHRGIPGDDVIVVSVVSSDSLRQYFNAVGPRAYDRDQYFATLSAKRRIAASGSEKLMPVKATREATHRAAAFGSFWSAHYQRAAHCLFALRIDQPRAA